MLNFSKIKIASILLLSFLSIFFSLDFFVSGSNKSFVKNILPKSKINLGLDLKGGSQLLLQTYFDYYHEKKILSVKEFIEKAFDDDQIRYSSEFDNLNKNVKFIISSESQLKNIIKILNEVSGIKKDRVENNIFKISFTDKELQNMQKDLVAQSIEIVRRRVDETGTKEPIIIAQGSDRILLQMPGAKNSDDIKNLLGKTAKLSFRFVSDKFFTSQEKYQITNSEISLTDFNNNIFILEKEVQIGGEYLVDASATYYQGKPAVSFRFNQYGAKKFSEITANNIGRFLAVTLDDKVITYPKINSTINNGSGVISGNFSTKEANNLAILLRAGALPAPLSIIEERTIGASLGDESIRKGMESAILAFIAVSIMMIIFYRFFGVIANIALLVNVAMVFSALSLIGATLTLPGLAGIALTMGMSVDSNVLIYERIKEELKNNKSIFNSLEQGFSQAFRTILDSNITTLIIAMFLFIFGSGSVKGFAVTLTIGILSSMFCAILLTRMIIAIWVKKFKPKKLTSLTL